MAQAKKVRRRNASDTMPPWLTEAAREALFWLTAAFAVVLAVALASFNPDDPSFNSTGTGAVHNLIGPAGAWTSEILLFALGLSAYLLPILVAYCGWMISRRLARQGVFTRLVRIAALIVALAALSTLLTLLVARGPDWLPAAKCGGGGVIGCVVSTPVTEVVGETGAGLLLLAVLLAGVTLATGLSWLALMDRLGAFLVRGYEWIVLRGRRRREQRDALADRAERVETVQREIVRRKGRPQPRIEPAITTLEPGPRAQRARQKSLFPSPVMADALPSPEELLDPPPEHGRGYTDEVLRAMSQQVELKLRDFGVEV
ncbi:MAG: DNA translocase FtsK 4TM domain-containing protein, partial [Gammaproteobacteria bacterium]